MLKALLFDNGAEVIEYLMMIIMLSMSKYAAGEVGLTPATRRSNTSPGADGFCSRLMWKSVVGRMKGW